SAMRRAFLHIALHDLKAPVGATVMLLENLASGLGGPLTGQQAHWTQRAQARLQELLAFIRDLGLLAELETSRVEALAGPVDLGALVRKVVEQHQDLAQQKRHSLRTEVAAGLPPVHGVERLLHEAVANYLTNAIKYTPDGGAIVARVLECGALAPLSSSRPGVRVEVTDTGCGIAPADQGRLFNEFVRIAPQAALECGPDESAPLSASASGPRPPVAPISGTGLGLSIVRRIAEAHGGRVGVLSQPGQGSTFFMELPVSGEAAICPCKS
ncbi:MAG: HAMP domain-containing sensor histidine kinase, partial [Planctomycetota bacterium]